MSKQLLQAAINAKGALEKVIEEVLGFEGITPRSIYNMEDAISQLDAAITTAQRQEQMQAADAYEAQFAPIESFDSAEGSPICPECGAVMLAEYDGNEQIIGYDCAACLAQYSYLCDVEGAIDDE